MKQFIQRHKALTITFAVILVLGLIGAISGALSSQSGSPPAPGTSDESYASDAARVTNLRVAADQDVDLAGALAVSYDIKPGLGYHGQALDIVIAVAQNGQPVGTAHVVQEDRLDVMKTTHVADRFAVVDEATGPMTGSLTGRVVDILPA